MSTAAFSYDQVISVAIICFRLYGQFTMETILATAFGFKVELLRGKVQGGDKLIQAAQNIFNQNSGGGLLAMTLTSLHCTCFLIVRSVIYCRLEKFCHELLC